MVKVYALRECLQGKTIALSDAIQRALVDVFKMPAEKRAHRFFPLERENVFAPPDRSDDYVLIELTIMGGRQRDTKKALVRALFDNIQRDVGIALQDIEVVLLEAPPENWGFRGLHGDEAQLNYRVNV